MPTWLLKTEPGDYSFADLQRDKKTVWDGVKNNLALQHIRAIKKGDRVLVYHTGSEKSVVGVAQATRDAFPDPKAKDPKLAVVELRPVKPLKQPVPLSAIKSDARFKDFVLVKIGRLSVMPVPADLEKALLKMAGE